LIGVEVNPVQKPFNPADILNEIGVGFESGSDVFDENSRTLLMVHGAGGRSQIWRRQVSGLKDIANTLALDLPGHGKTTGESKSNVKDYAQWLGLILDRLRLNSVILMGHSLGGAIVLNSALLYPNLLRGIILVGTGPRLPVNPSLLEGLSSNFEKTVDTINGYAFASGTDPAMVEEGARFMKEAGPVAVRDGFLASDRFDVEDNLSEINLPCLILCGEKDKMTPVKLSISLNQGIRGSVLQILPSAGHMLMIESTEAFNSRVRDFILYS